MKQFNLALLVLLMTFLWLPELVQAQGSCQAIYGGGQTCNATPSISITKQVQNPATNKFTDNLGVNDPKFNPGDTVTFQLVVKNNTNGIAKNVLVKDAFPQYVNNLSGNPGKFDQNSKILSFSIDSLNPGESKTYIVKAQINNGNQLPSDQSTLCVVDQASASFSGKTDLVGSQFCIHNGTSSTVLANQTKGGLVVYPAPLAKKTPPTGPEELSLLMLIPTSLSGWYLRAKTRFKK